MNHVHSRDARTGTTTQLPFLESTPAEVADAVAAAANAAQWLGDSGITGRAALLTNIAAALEGQREQLVGLADSETGLGETRLTGEIARTAWQLRFLAQVIADKAYLEVTIDQAGLGPLGPQPDLRRMLVPLGPIAAFGASNFPFAFSTIGGDSASALAAGCPVVFKAHYGHPRTSAAVDAIVRTAVADAGGPPGVFATVYGVDAGVALVEHPDVAGVGFTGSLAGGRALFDRAMRRPTPIPFYGELGSVNPLVVTESAAAERGAEIGAGIAGSVLQGAGQFCTKPGVLLIPAGRSGDTVVAALTEAINKSESGPLLTETIASQYDKQVYTSRQQPAASLVAQAQGGSTIASILEVNATDLDGTASELLEEHFGPFALVVRYCGSRELSHVLGLLPASLAGTVQAANENPDNELAGLVNHLARRAGRVIVNGFPTGVAVSWAMHHGGPYPASTAAADTSVGAASIRRWLRPVTYQSIPGYALPPELQDANLRSSPRRVDGVQQL